MDLVHFVHITSQLAFLAAQPLMAQQHSRLKSLVSVDWTREESVPNDLGLAPPKYFWWRVLASELAVETEADLIAHQTTFQK